MDFNIAIILKFASFGEGIDQYILNIYIYIYNIISETGKLVKSNAKVILSGLGEDELFSGYSRYRVAFLRGGL